MMKLTQDKRFLIPQFIVRERNRILHVMDANTIPGRDLALEVFSTAPGNYCFKVHASPCLCRRIHVIDIH